MVVADLAVEDEPQAVLLFRAFQLGHDHGGVLGPLSLRLSPTEHHNHLSRQHWFGLGWVGVGCGRRFLQIRTVVLHLVPNYYVEWSLRPDPSAITHTIFLPDRMYDVLNIIRTYLLRVVGEQDESEPVVLRRKERPGAGHNVGNLHVFSLHAFIR